MLLTSALQVYIQSNLNYCLRLCLVRVKPFLERKTFSCVWLSQNSFYGKLILVFGLFKHFTRKCIKFGKTLVRRAARSTIAITPLVNRRARSSDAHRSSIAPLVDPLDYQSANLLIVGSNQHINSRPGEVWHSDSNFPTQKKKKKSTFILIFGIFKSYINWDWVYNSNGFFLN